MERSHLAPDALVELEFVSQRSIGTHWHENIELDFVVSGEVRLVVEQDAYQLASGDICLVNAGRKHSFEGSDSALIARFLISYAKVRELLGLERALFWCNSAQERNVAYESLRRTIFQLLNQEVCGEGKNRLFIRSLHYQMLHILAENFLLSPSSERYRAQDDAGDDRMQQIVGYVRTNFRESISLSDLAEMLYLSPTYVSRYIRQASGGTFMQLVNSVRLEHAMEDLAYTDDSIMKIALENGFASVAAYNKAFRDAYGMSPSEFRRERLGGREQAGEARRRERAQVRERVRGCLERNPSAALPEPVLRVDIEAEMGALAPCRWDNCTSKLANVGAAAELLDAQLQQQVIAGREDLGFEYVGFWDIFDPRLYLDIHAGEDGQNFGRLDAILDFLVRNHLKPYIELGFKTKRVIRTTAKIVYERAFDEDFANEAEMASFYRGLFAHVIARYGSWEVCSWRFEYWERVEAASDAAGVLQYDRMTPEEHLAYFRRFGIIARALRSQLPEAQIGGAGFPARVYGEENLAKILALWVRQQETPDFISISCYPYQQEREGGVAYEKRTTDLAFVRYGIELARHAMGEAGLSAFPLYVTEYNLTLSSRNALNDSCLKAAFVVGNAIDCMGTAGLLGHQLYSDYFAEERDTNAPLFGGGGLLTRDGIPKPAYFAHEFLHMLYPDVVCRGENYIVTRNARGSVRMVCHNLKRPNFNYYRVEEDSLDVEQMASILSDREFLAIRLALHGLSDGTYVVKTSLLNAHHGSVQDTWRALDREPNLTAKEMEHLRMSSHGDISTKRCECCDGVLELEWEMEPNEIRYLHIYQR